MAGAIFMIFMTCLVIAAGYYVVKAGWSIFRGIGIGIWWVICGIGKIISGFFNFWSNLYHIIQSAIREEKWREKERLERERIASCPVRIEMHRNRPISLIETEIKEMFKEIHYYKLNGRVYKGRICELVNYKLSDNENERAAFNKLLAEAESELVEIIKNNTAQEWRKGSLFSALKPQDAYELMTEIKSGMALEEQRRATETAA